MVNLINRIPPTRYRHAVVCLTGADEFRRRIADPSVEVLELHKRDGQDWGLYTRLWLCLRRLRPDVVHTRNLAALEAQLPALLAGVGGRVHSEHGWDVYDRGGHNRKYRMLRRGLRPLVGQFIALSGELEGYLRDGVGVAPARLSRICNGVDTERFRPRHADEPRPAELAALAPPGTVLIGTVGRMQPIKDPLNLARAFVRLLEELPPEQGRDRLRLAMIGGGPLLEDVAGLLEAHDARDLAWLPGDRSDVPGLMRALDLFVLPSSAEGISNTILEAMASGLAVVATDVGGNAELVQAGYTGEMVPPSDPGALAAAIRAYLDDPGRPGRHGAAGRRRVEARFGMDVMVREYLAVYDRARGGRSG